MRLGFYPVFSDWLLLPTQLFNFYLPHATFSGLPLPVPSHSKCFIHLFLWRFKKLPFLATISGLGKSDQLKEFISRTQAKKAVAAASATEKDG
jgi:hypothetical protein